MNFNPTFIDHLVNYTAGTWSMTILSAGIDSISSGPSLTLSGLTTQSVSTPTYTNQSITYNLVSIVTSDIQVQNSIQSYSVIEGNTLKVTPDLS